MSTSRAPLIELLAGSEVPEAYAAEFAMLDASHVRTGGQENEIQNTDAQSEINTRDPRPPQPIPGTRGGQHAILGR